MNNEIAQTMLQMHGELDQAETRERRELRYERFSLLLVDDSDEMRQLTTILLRPLPLKIVEAANGERAIGLFKDNKFDGVLLDCAMPGMDGFTVAAELRGIERDQPLRPIAKIGFMTGLTGIVDKTTLLQDLRATLFLRKPEDMTSEAAEKVAAWLGIDEAGTGNEC